MKNFLIQFLLTLILTLLVQLFLPWWSLVIVAAVVGLFFSYKYGAVSFLAGFLAVGLLWLLSSVWLSSGAENQVLANRVGELFGGMSRIYLVYTTAMLGAVLGGLAAMTGTLGRKLVKQ
ncbi:MAG: hypothetical protein AAGG68_17500 [Bacteroidota bacterium]